MANKANPYISFNGNARQAMEYYRSVFGGELKISTFKEFNLSRTPADDNKVMHSVLEISPEFTIMGADIASHMQFDNGQRVTIALSGENETELGSYFQKLSSGGSVIEKWDQAPWGDYFGLLTDKFGVVWMLDVPNPNTMQQGAVSHTEQHTTR